MVDLLNYVEQIKDILTKRQVTSQQLTLYTREKHIYLEKVKCPDILVF